MVKRISSCPTSFVRNLRKSKEEEESATRKRERVRKGSWNELVGDLVHGLDSLLLSGVHSLDLDDSVGVGLEVVDGGLSVSSVGRGHDVGEGDV